MGDWCGMAVLQRAVRKHRMALGAAVARRLRIMILRHKWRWWLLVCEWRGMARALIVQAGHRHVRHCVVEWWALSRKAKGSRSIAWRASAITGFHLLDQHCREAVAVRRGVRFVEARRVYAIFERWRTVARERARVEGAVVRQLWRQRLWVVLGEWRNFADWRRGVRMLWERGERGEGGVGHLVMAVSGGSDEKEEAVSHAVSHEGAYAIGAARGGSGQGDEGGGRGGGLGLEWGAMQFVAAAARVRVRSSAICLRKGGGITKGAALVAWLALAYRRLHSKHRRVLLSKMLSQFAYKCSVVRRTTCAQVLCIVSLCRKYSRALTFQMCVRAAHQDARTHAAARFLVAPRLPSRLGARSVRGPWRHSRLPGQILWLACKGKWIGRAGVIRFFFKSPPYSDFFIEYILGP
jgi:hypothetical protein